MTRRTPPPEDCPLDPCLRLLASAWTTRILYFLDCGPRRFGDLRRDLGKISPKVLSQRLRAMESQGLIARRRLPTYPAQVEYRLTAFGREFEPVLKAMIKVAQELQRVQLPPRSSALGPSSATAAPRR
jgi:DNA-binding HxlR family transcriptional regulator